MPAEPTQQQGHDGAEFAKKWLESTTWIELPFNAYRTAPMCELRLLNGKVELVDLAGRFLTKPFDRIVFVEAKNYTTNSGLQGKYNEFLANAYSATAKQMAARPQDPKFEFIFVTRHPFGEGQWKNQLSLKTLEEAVKKNAHVLGDEHEYDPDIGVKVMDRMWLLVYHDKQASLTLSQSELSRVESVLKRKGEGIA